ncbi:uncharacterized protein LOC106665625 isoform X1 [Cimex lectularius]|uniref:RBR-type E3 ubiquitin transferase n=1 Tax=Cimex lectularius TaxID=79782 RepID=A0A8I6SQ27_CIMLE|nr:uncharacterized protein LOC106665625 isoform X1 [Cimex lectularius]
MENKERWRPLGGGMNPSARLKAARSMPSWMQTRGVAYPPPPPPPVNDPPIDPDYEVIEFPGQTYSNAPMQEIKPASGKKCDLCGSSTPSVHCAQCSQNFCPSCDDMYHRHPKRQTHFRKDLDGKQTIVRPPLPPKGEAAQPPVPPPRKNKRTSRTPIPSPLDQSPTSKVGFVGSLKRLVGGRPLPAAPFTANSVSPHMGHPHHQELSPQMGGFQEGMFGDWNLKNHRAGSFSNLHSPGFNPLVQAHSMAQLNCPSCQHGVIWDPWHGNTMGPQSLMGLPPWSGIPPNGTWHSSAFLNRRSSHEQSRRNSLRRHHVQDSSSASEDDDRFVHNRRRNPSPALSRRSRNPHSEYESEEDDREKNWSRSPALTHRISRRASMAEGINRTHRHDDDTLSTYGGRRASHQPTLSRRESMGHPLDKMSKHEYDRNLDRRGSRRNDFDSMTNQNQQRYESEDTRQRRRTFDDSKTSYTEEGRLSRGSNKGFSEFEDPSSNSPRTSEQNDFNEPESRRRKSRRNERFSDTGRRRTSPISYKYGENVVNAHTETPNTVNNLETNGNSAGDRNEEEEEMGPIPETQWECVHCTFINEPGTRVCAICCKTTAKPKSVKSQNVQPDLKGQKDFKSTKRFEEQRTTKVVKDYDEVTITEGLRKMNMGSSPQSTSMQKLQIKSPQKGLQPNDSQKHLTSTGTSPPPQSISTQTYDVTGHKLKRTTSLADYAEWKAPQRSYSKQSLFSDTQSLPVTPPKRRSPEKFNPVDGTAVPPEQPPSVKNMDQLTMQRNLKRAGSQPPDYISTLVQKQVKQGLEMVKLLREAEEQQFSADDLAVALLHCEDGDPVAWLQKNWRNMIDTVVTLGTNYGHERKENTVGTISASEAREALRMHDGNVWAAVTECVEQRQKKYAELLSRGNFSREDIVTVLTANHGNLEAAYMELSKSQLKPFLMRIWGPPQGTDNESGDFTKLAHDSDWEGGKGNKRDEEVSLFSNDSNNDRIQTWLDNYVYKPKLSQSMLQLNSISSKNSDSYDFPQNSLKTQNTKSSRNRRFSDVHRYLTHCFTANNSLQIALEMQELSKPVEKIDPLQEFLTKNLGQDSVPKLNQSENKNSVSANSSNQIIMSQDHQNDAESFSDLAENTHISLEDSSVDINLKFDTEEKHVPPNSNASSNVDPIASESDAMSLNNANQDLQGPNGDTISLDTDLTSENEDDDEYDYEDDNIAFIESLPQLEKSLSPSSSGSYESIEMHGDQKVDKSEYTNTTSIKDVDLEPNEISSYLNEEMGKLEVFNSKLPSEKLEETNFITLEPNHTARDENRQETTMSNVEETDEFPNHPDSIEENTEIITVRIPIKVPSVSLKDVKSESDIVVADLNTKQKRSKPLEIITIDEQNENSDAANNVQEIVQVVDEVLNNMLIQIDNSNSKIGGVNSTLMEEQKNDNVDSIIINAIELPAQDNTSKGETNKESNHENRAVSSKTNQEAFPTYVNTVLKENKQDIENNKDVNHIPVTNTGEQQSNNVKEDFSPSSSTLSPISAVCLQKSTNCIDNASDGASDSDVSPIPTDSEKDNISQIYQNIQNNEDTFNQNSSHEIVNMLKESLTKDDIVEKIVSSLFQRVLRASIDLQQFPINEQKIQLEQKNSKQNLVDSKNTSDIEENSDNMFYEAEESQDHRFSGNSGLGSHTINTSIDTINIGQNQVPEVLINPKLKIHDDTNNSTKTECNIQIVPTDLKKDATTESFQVKEELGSFEREVRRILAEGLVQTYSQAELVVKLKNLDFDEEQCIAAAAECNDVEMAVAYLQQECYLCAGKYTMKQMVSMLDCEHICCQECAKNYFTLQITERTINDCVCPFCKEPDISKLEEDKTLHYFSNLDILLKTLVKENVHELFQRKLRDRTLMQDPNFIWCGQCSSGFIANPRQKRLICPDCKNISCASCRKTWQKEHEKMTCKEFKEWLEYNDPENQLERHLAENGITCPKCTTRYVLAKGGCMHLICPHCKHEFCQGCGKPFLMGNNCKLSPFCEKLGLHSHHPRNCLFYLRDKEPKQLQRLLEDNGIDYRKTNENLTNRCNVQILKETDEGFLEAICGFPIEGCGLCRTHFIEHLVCLIKDNKVDPVVVMDIIDAQQELRRHGKSLPTREDFKSDHEYLAVCMKVIKEDIPLE